MTGKATTVFLAAMFASQVALTAVSFADGKKGKGKTTVTSTVTSFKAKLAPVPPPTTPVAADLSGECEGQAKYKKKVTTKTPPLPALPSTSTEESFSGEVACPILDMALVSTDVYDMHLARGGVDYAVCSLVIKEIEFEYNSGSPLVPVGIEGEYAVKVSQKSPPTPPTVKQKLGGCTAVDLVTAVVPAVKLGDTATVFLNAGATPVLTGTFSTTSGSDDDDHDDD
ncbi:MAG: hypothetical protein Q8S00_26585 [Deltaproteobacteria bacterium]|nr:hypothetical protein [Deltaproteobacteria bacterium]MDZ4342818.1 hypothetical protein [Candidatus Binatia bacterium]